jgi:hypothetical protein
MPPTCIYIELLQPAKVEYKLRNIASRIGEGVSPNIQPSRFSSNISVGVCGI